MADLEQYLGGADFDVLNLLADYIQLPGRRESKTNSHSYGGNPRDLLSNECELRAPLPSMDTVEMTALGEPKS